ncbi:MFS transporter [Microbacterium halophytorum]|uniref:MFS transporter n=1 Tax=Microbacterium halophytorum TaxID=2067568 RepID=UPI001E463BD1|nr:MFS transporter [Microbacterium halophytorum]
MTRNDSSRTTPLRPDDSTATIVAATLNTAEMRRILASSFIGTAVEYYDFILYSVAAAVVFNNVFFSGLPAGVALFASFATLAVGYVMRPLGGIVFGHFGDRVGRKKMLVLSMMMMGIATTLIGLLPTTAQIGVVAPIVLVLLRLVQGIAVGGEWGGAALMAMEHAPQRKRGFATSFANAGGPAGAILATVVVSVVSSATGENFLTWGWRIPFLLSAVLIVVGLVIRLRVSESPLFRRLEQSSAKRRLPILEVITDHPRAVLLALLATLSFYCCQGIITVWGVSAAVEAGADRTSVLAWKAVGAGLTLVITFLSARLSDRIGRRTVLLSGGILGVVFAFPMLLLLTNGTVWGFATADLLGNGLIQGLLYGPIGAFIAEQFPTKVRYTAASLAYQGASTLGAGFTPMIATGLVLVAGGTIWLVGGFWILVMLIGMLAVIVTPEGSKKALA